MFQKNRFLFVLLFAVQSLFAQIPQGFNYQATVRNQTGELLTNKSVDFKFHILQGSSDATPTYSESHNISTDDLGVVHLSIGSGSAEAGAFNQIDWSLGNYHMAIEINTGDGFIDMGTTQLMSVPFALYALNSGNDSTESKNSAEESVFETVAFTKTNGISKDTGLFIANETGSWYTCLAQSLKDVTKIKFKALTYNNDQASIYYYNLSDFDSYTFVSKMRYTDEVELTQADFPENATHFMIGAIASKTPNVYCNIYKEAKALIKDNSNEINSLSTFQTQQSGQIRVALFDAETYEIGYGMQKFSGRKIASQSQSSFFSDYADVLSNQEYISQYVIGVYGYKANGDYVEEINTVNNTSFVITNPEIKKIRCVFPSNFHNVFLSGFEVYGSNGSKRYYPYRKEKEFHQPNMIKRYIQGFGDSLIGRGEMFVTLQEKTGHPATYLTYGGRGSSFIRDRFEENGNFDNAINVFWVGQNNTDEPDTIIEDLKHMVRLLNHNRFVVLTPIVGAPSSLEMVTERVEINAVISEKIQSIFGNHSVVLNAAIVNGGYDMGGVKLKTSFVQPLIGGSVDVQVSDVSFFQTINSNDASLSYIPDEKYILIGFNGLYDRYEITSSSIDGAGGGKEGTLTLTLISSSRIGSGSTVENIETIEAATGSSNFYSVVKYLQIYKEADKFCIDNKMIPSSFREDAIHPSNLGGACVGELLAQAIKTLGFYE